MLSARAGRWLNLVSDAAPPGSSLGRLLLPYALSAIWIGIATLVTYFILSPIGLTFPKYPLLFLLAIVLSARTGYGPGLLAVGLVFFASPRFLNPQFDTDFSRLALAAFTSLMITRMASVSRASSRQNEVIAKQNFDLSQIVGELRNRTEEVSAAHAALDAVLNAAIQTGIVGTDREGLITLFNTGAEAILGFESAAVVGKPLTGFLESGTDVPFEFADLIRPLQQAAFCEHDLTLVRHDGARLLANLSLTAQKDQDSAVRGYVAVIRDITEQRRNEAAILEAMQAAEAAARSRSEFLATMSHEIRTPMNGVIGMTGLLLDSPLLPDQREYASTIRNSGETLLAIINDILDFSKIEAGKLELEEVEFDIYSAVEECAEIIAANAHQKGLELVMPARTSPAGLVRGDQGRVRQVLLNLISNAIKFTAVGEVVLTVDMERSGDDSVAVRISVSDTGIGIPLEAQSKLFQPFSQGDASTTRRYGGTGLGLAISKRLVELMGGEIGLVSKPGKGSTFWFTSNFKLAEQPESPEPELAGRRLLVVDDNATNRRVLQLQLERHGCVVELAPDAATALSQLLEPSASRSRFDAVLTDQNMPGRNGLSLAAAIRSNPLTRDLPILVLSSQGDQRSLIQDLGIQDMLLKPVRESQLVRSLQTIFSRRAVPLAVSQRDLPAGSHALTGSGRILVAEDNPVNQRVVALMLRKLGYSPEVVANGIEALQALELSSFRAILMDCQMPEMDGFEATRVIRGGPWRTRRTPIIALTANALPGEREKCIAAGMNDYLAKPLNLEMLGQKLNEWLAPMDHSPGAAKVS